MNAEHTQMIEDCENRSEKLSDWEAGFIDGMSQRDWLTDKQAAVLERIWERIT